MSRRGVTTLLLLLLLAAGCAAEQPDPEPEATRTTTMVAVPPLPSLVVAAGSSVPLEVPVEIAPGYHVQANPAANEFLIPLELTIEGRDGIRIGPPTYPPGVEHRLEGTDEGLPTYEGTVTIELQVEAEDQAAPGERTLEGTLRYQACDAKRCFFPATLPVPVTVTVPP